MVKDSFSVEQGGSLGMNLPARQRHQDWCRANLPDIAMRSLALLCLLTFVTPAHAGTPEQHYLDLRDRYIAKFSKAKEKDETYKQHDAALEAPSRSWFEGAVKKAQSQLELLPLR